MRRLLLLLALLASLSLAACGEEDEPEGTTSTPAAEATPEATPETPADAGCEKAEAPEPKKVGKIKKPTLELDAGKTYIAKVATSCGDFTIELDAKRAPKTGGSFATLARDKFFDGTTFHRVVKGFVVQGGDPQGDGQGGPGYSVVEAPPEDLQYTRGVVAMAKTQTEAAGTSGSQFFVVTGEDTMLPPDYALLGKVTEGMENVDKISAVETVPPEDGEPTAPIVIESITIQEK
jgi:cyclophilin family peptidyl-prolyl cis-trans isomerase